VSALAALLAEVVDAKRVHVAGEDGSLAGRRFLGAWAALCAGAPLRHVAVAEAAAAVCAARLGGIDARVLSEAGLTPEQAAEVLTRGFDEVTEQLGDGPLVRELRAAASAPVPGAPSTSTDAAGPGRAALTGPARTPAGPDGVADAVPPWVRALAGQPRAGATRPGHPRLMLDPAESHAEHCWVVATGAVLAAAQEGAEPELPFLCGLVHHAHNAVLPDAGFAGEALLGEHLQPVIERLTAQALDDLPPELAARCREARELLVGAETPEARAFHTADVLDRVLEMRHHARKAAFTVDQALDDLDLVHEGPLQAFGLQVVEAAGLR
jgi:5'-deoxynucleotidase YfbR-like HD superfamily hydrolase